MSKTNQFGTMFPLLGGVFRSAFCGRDQADE